MGALEKPNRLTIKNNSIVLFSRGNDNSEYKYQTDDNGTINL